MKQRRLGSSNLMVSALGLGCMGMSDFYGPSDFDESMKLIRKAVDLGINFFDTADMYGVGHNEVLVGRALKKIRDKVIIATKFGNMRRVDGALLGVNGKPEYVKACCDMSLKRLGVDVIDLYYQHRVDPQTPIEETVGAMAELVKAGKVRFLGLSEASPATIRRAQAVHPIAALQTEYSLWTRDPEKELLAVCRELDLAFVAYSPLGRGILSGKYRNPEQFAENDYRLVMPRYQDKNFKRNMKLVRRLKAMAKIKKCTPAQLSLAWVLSRGDQVIPIPGTRHLKFLKDNIAALEVAVTAAENKELEEIFAPEAVSGNRYHDYGMQLIDGQG
jgi:aryl-alcohol dehydrogenase-like predicted oxidoreductase